MKPRALNWLLRPVAGLYGLLMWLRFQFYQRNWCKTQKIAVPVIVVGNVSVGGTGKSPLVREIVDFLVRQGWQPGIIARGYGGDSSFWPRAVAMDDNPSAVGDEPLMLKRQCKRPVVVGADRVASSDLLVDKYHCDVIVSDDGFQHLRLNRDVGIIVIDGERLFGNGWCLPAGPLREYKSAVKRADMVVVNGDSEQISTLSWIDAPYFMSVKGDALISLSGDKTMSLNGLSGKTVHAVTGLGNPRRFYQGLDAAGLNIVCHTFPDHHQFITADFNFADGDIIVMTEKDAVKCQAINISVECWVLPIRAALTDAFFTALELKLRKSHR